jgi:hypothetical protein
MPSIYYTISSSAITDGDETNSDEDRYRFTAIRVEEIVASILSKVRSIAPDAVIGSDGGTWEADSPETPTAHLRIDLNGDVLTHNQGTSLVDLAEEDDDLFSAYID